MSESWPQGTHTPAPLVDPRQEKQGLPFLQQGLLALAGEPGAGLCLSLPVWQEAAGFGASLITWILSHYLLWEGDCDTSGCVLLIEKSVVLQHVNRTEFTTNRRSDELWFSGSQVCCTVERCCLFRQLPGVSLFTNWPAEGFKEPHSKWMSDLQYEQLYRSVVRSLGH